MTPHVGVLIVTDGRTEYLRQMVATLKLGGRVAYGPLVVVDDSADPYHWEQVGRLLASLDWHASPIHVRHLSRQGLAASVQSGWSTLLRRDDVDFVLHVEEDFTFPDALPVEAMVDILRADPSLAQVVLKRQPWSPVEVVSGGIIEQNPDAYTDEHDAGSMRCWVRHQLFFSLNPCVYRREVMSSGWGQGEDEGAVTARLVDDGWAFAFFGHREDEPRCLHIGTRRSAAWKL